MGPVQPSAAPSPALDPALAGLEPARLWALFDEIRRIPRPSKHEELVRAYVLEFARQHGCEAAVDAAGNVVVRVSASAGFEAAPIVVLQGHLDMVCEKDPGVEIDFFVDPIRLRRSGDRLGAIGTSLGADNGVAVAAGLALLGDDSVRHGPLELLFTVDEETGLNGVRLLDPSLVRGRILLNLDSEEEGVVTIAGAGARSVECFVATDWQPAPAAETFRLRVSGATGGHSGGDVHRGRANPLRLLAGWIAAIPGAAIASFTGGSVRNAIPRQAEAVVLADAAAIQAALAPIRDAALVAHQSSDPGLSFGVEATAPAARVLGRAAAANLLTLLREAPIGVLAWSRDLPGLVETSANLATAQTGEEAVAVHFSVRSAIDAERDLAVEKLAALARELGARVEAPAGYPGWRPDPTSPLLATAKAVYRDLYGREPEVKGVHGGLECGVIGSLIPGMQMISIGPDLADPHSPSETVSVSSVARVLGDYLAALLGRLAEEGRDTSG